MLRKLVPETCASRLVREACTCVGQSCTSFFLYKFLARNWTPFNIPEQKLSRDMNRATWLAGESFKKLWWTCVKFFARVSCVSFLKKFLVQVSWACVAGNNVIIFCHLLCWWLRPKLLNNVSTFAKPHLSTWLIMAFIHYKASLKFTFTASAKLLREANRCILVDWKILRILKNLFEDLFEESLKIYSNN